MAGIKGRSGRRGWRKEVEMRELWELSLSVIRNALSAPDFPRQKKAEIASHILSKLLPRDVNMNNINPERIRLIIINSSQQKTEEKQNDSRQIGNNSETVSGEIL